MDETAFRQALDPKATGSFLLAQALADEPLDFLVFFSSANSLEGNPGQANYVAGCVFKDAFAHYLRVQHDLPVKIINWGYWGELGITATPEIRERLARQGIGSISEQEGIEAFRRILALPVSQASPIKASRSMLENLGIDPSRVSVPAPVGISVGTTLREFAGREGRPAADVCRLLEAFVTVDELARRWLLAQLVEMGLTAGRELTVDGWLEHLGVVPRYRALLAALFAMLEADQALICRDGCWRLATEARPLSPAALQAERERLRAAEPMLVPYLVLLESCLGALSRPAARTTGPHGSLVSQGLAQPGGRNLQRQPRRRLL